MRVPVSKIYRAFPELDDFSDEECRRLITRVGLQVKQGLLAFFAAWLALPFGVAAGLALGWSLARLIVPDIGRVLWLETSVDFSDQVEFALFLFPAGIIGVGAMLLTRDFLLRRLLLNAIQVKLETVRCFGCRYILIAQVPEGDALRCPECGRLNGMAELGITEQDLIPPVA